MSSSDFPTDTVCDLVSPEDQRRTAELVRESFSQVFRGAATERAPEAKTTISERCRDWQKTAPNPQAAALRLALLLTGLDQWGLAFSQAFGITAIPDLTTLISDLRTAQDAPSDARLLQAFERVQAREADAIDFKICLRRDIHLTLWHALTAAEDLDAGQTVLATLVSLLVAVDQAMPTLGWRLVADSLMHIQWRLIQPDAPPLAGQAAPVLFEALSQTLPAPRYKAALALSTELLAARPSKTTH